MNDNNSKRTTGRSSSQISIYDYPEHLNPFYEDENHKRIRFWKIGSSNKSQRSGRSNSFSFSGLKDMWAFKSLKLKKRSSTLGINKTSESPPMLRRQIYPIQDTYSTFDSRIRHTTDMGIDGSFVRNGNYRNSLQDINRNTFDGAIRRNDRIRNTIQNGYKTLPSNQANENIYKESLKSTPNTRYLSPSIAHGSSQSSLNSTNPFEYDDDNDDIISRAESVDIGSIRRSGRKKRRAPPPPISSTPISVEIHRETIQSNDQSAVSKSKVDDLTEFSNLTAQIVSFVRTADTDDEKISTNFEQTNTALTEPTKSSNSHNSETKIKDTEITSTKSHSIPIINEASNNNIQRKQLSFSSDNNNEPITLVQVRLIDKTKERTVQLDKSRESPENNEDYPMRSSVTPERLSPTKQIFNEPFDKPLNIVVDTFSEKNKPSPPKIIIRCATEDETVHGSSEITQEASNELKITESSENLASVDNNYKEQPVNSEKYKIKFVALKSFSPESIRKNNSNENSDNNNTAAHSTNAFTTKPVPPDRRRSVKDIIESINKSQSLLKMNQDAMKNKILNDEESNKSIIDNNNLTKSSKDDKEISTIISNMGETSGNNDDYCISDIPLMVEKFDELNNNNDEIFKKCKNNRQDVEKFRSDNSQLEWNPVPKPRRTKNLANDYDIENKY